MSVFERLDNSFNSSLIARAMKVAADQGGGVVLSFSQRLGLAWRLMPQEYFWDYVLFLTVMVGGALLCVWFAVRAVRRGWVWRPGQKTIVWLIGLSALFIFRVGMWQVGHNLAPLESHKGRELVSRALLLPQWTHIPHANEQDWTGEAGALGDWSWVEYSPAARDACVAGDVMFRVSFGRSEADEKGWVRQLLVLNVYRFPYMGPWNLVLVKVRLGEPVLNKRSSERVLGCYVREERLYVAYLLSGKGQEDKGGEAFRQSLRLLVVDISDPAEPRLVRDDELPPPVHCRAGSMAVYGDYCYVNTLGTMPQLLVISLADQDEPQVVSRLYSLAWGWWGCWWFWRCFCMLSQ